MVNNIQAKLTVYPIGYAYGSYKGGLHKYGKIVSDEMPTTTETLFGVSRGILPYA